MEAAVSMEANFNPTLEQGTLRPPTGVLTECGREQDVDAENARFMRSEDDANANHRSTGGDSVEVIDETSVGHAMDVSNVTTNDGHVMVVLNVTTNDGHVMDVSNVTTCVDEFEDQNANRNIEPSGEKIHHVTSEVPPSSFRKFPEADVDVRPMKDESRRREFQAHAGEFQGHVGRRSIACSKPSFERIQRLPARRKSGGHSYGHAPSSDELRRRRRPKITVTSHHSEGNVLDRQIEDDLQSGPSYWSSIGDEMSLFGYPKEMRFSPPPIKRPLSKGGGNEKSRNGSGISATTTPVSGAGGAGVFLRDQIISFFQPSDNKLAMKLFGNKNALLKEKLRQKAVGNWVIHPCSSFR